MRTKRTNGTKTYEYIYNGSQLTQMKVGSDVYNFTYDASGTPLTLTKNGVVYYYITNLQGDVIGLRDNTREWAYYTYDAWGVCEEVIGEPIGRENPLRYRGYVFDQETQLYYLQSRYYNPNLGRFLNADALTSTGQGLLGNNMFAYCGNNPVVFFDPNGKNGENILDWWLLTFGPPALAEPTPVGEILLIAGLLILNAYSRFDDFFDENSEGTPTVEPGQQPTEKDGYLPPKGGPKQGKTKSGEKGWVDKYGNIWVPAPTGSQKAHGGGHWDVQSPQGGYSNVYPGGHIRPGKAPYPRLPIIPGD